MPRTKAFNLSDRRFLFRCYNCKTKRMVTVGPGVRRRSVRCQKCSIVTNCLLNRRQLLREQQRGKALMFFDDGTNIEVDLYDISNKGVGFEINFRELRKVALRREVTFKCNWNSLLLNKGRYTITSIQNRRIGASLKR